MLRTEHDFTLPLGYVDADGTMHKEGTMRLATAADEILPMKDPGVQKNPAYLVIILLSRVITRLGGVDAINPCVIEVLFAKDLEYLQDFYNEINLLSRDGPTVTCPQCAHVFEEERAGVGGS